MWVVHLGERKGDDACGRDHAPVGRDVETSTPQIGVHDRGSVKVDDGCGGLFHHDPFRSDDELYEIEKQAQKLFPNTIVAKQGLEIIL